MSGLRVACGFHTLAQVAVGAAVGGAGALGWMGAGAALTRGALARGAARGALAHAVWACYFVGSALFIGKKMRSWLGHEKEL